MTADEHAERFRSSVNKPSDLESIDLWLEHARPMHQQNAVSATAEQLLRIRAKSGRNVPLQPNPAQRRFEETCTDRNIILKARQMGITTWIAARFFLKTIFFPGTSSLLVAHDQHTAEEIFKIVHRFWTNLPELLRKGLLRKSRSNVRMMCFPLLDSEFRVESAADADAGRGTTAQNLHASEVSRWPRDAAATLAGLRAAVSPEGEIVLESTPNGAAGCFYDEWQRAADSGYTQHFLPWWMEPGYRRALRSGPLTGLSAEELELRAKHALTDEQLNYRRELRSNFHRMARQEFAEDPESCFLSSGECVFDIERLEARLKECAEHSRRHGITRILPPKPDGAYVVGVDCSSGFAGGDYGCAQVIDRATGGQCAELHGRYTPEELAERTAELAKEYNTAWVAVEINNQGTAVEAFLRRVEKYPRLYYGENGSGFYTSEKSKSEIIAALAGMLRARPEVFADAAVLREMRTFVNRTDGKRGASNGAHDDRVMALGIAFIARDELAGKP